MPTYDYKCPVCGRGREVFKPLIQLDDPELCSHCSHAMNRQVSAPRIVGDYEGYDCPITGKWIEGRAAHRENLARHGCRVLESGEREAVTRFRQAEDEKLDKAVEETVDRFIVGLPTEKRDRLAAELEGGLDVQLTRSTPE